MESLNFSVFLRPNCTLYSRLQERVLCGVHCGVPVALTRGRAVHDTGTDLYIPCSEEFQAEVPGHQETTCGNGGTDLPV